MEQRRRCCSSGGGSVKHSIDFFKQKYREYVEYTMTEGSNCYYKNLNEFISAYENYRGQGVKNVMKELKYLSKYSTPSKTARAMFQKVKKYGGHERLKDLRNMNPREFASRYTDELKEEQKEAKSIYGDEFVGYIGVDWFGSD